MQMVKLVFSDSLICAISQDIRHNFLFGRRHDRNVAYAFALLYSKYNLFIFHHMKVIHAKKQINRTSTKNVKRF